MTRAGDRSQLRASDVARLSVRGMSSRPLRAVLSASGIAIGVAAMIAIVGITMSSRTELNDRLDELGTNRLQVTPGETLTGQTAKLSPKAPGMIDRLDGVQDVGYTATLDVGVYRSRYADPEETLGLEVATAGDGLLAATGTGVRLGRWFDPATSAYPTTVLGANAASRLGITGIGQQVWLGGRVFTVTGILEPAELTPEIDDLALISPERARKLFDSGASPDTVYLRCDESRLGQIRELVGPTASPKDASEVQVSRPSNALEAKEAANETLSTLLLGLGAVALLVGGIGVANTMVIAVIERHSEIGLRRALGATRRHIRTQFLAEAVVLSAAGGALGALLGATATSIVALESHWRLDLPAAAVGGGVGITILVGAVAGLYPAVHASRISPTVALTS